MNITSTEMWRCVKAYLKLYYNTREDTFWKKYWSGINVRQMFENTFYKFNTQYELLLLYSATLNDWCAALWHRGVVSLARRPKGGRRCRHCYKTAFHRKVISNYMNRLFRLVFFSIILYIIIYCYKIQ